MKNYFFTLTISLLTIFSAIAQDDNHATAGLWERLPGYIITNKGEKKEGYLKRFGKIKSQRIVKFFNELNDKKGTKYDPKDLKGYQIVDDYYETHPYAGLTGKTKVFLHRFVNGKINLFEYFQYVTKDVAEAAIAKKGNTEISIDIDGKELQTEILAVNDAKESLKFSSPKMVLGFKKVMSNYLKDYPELATKIKNKEKGYGVLKVLQIVDEYNSYFKK